MRWITAALFLALCSASHTARAEDLGRLNFAREVVAITHMSDKIRGLLRLLDGPVRQALSQQGVQSATIDAAVGRITTPSPDDIDRLMDKVAALYASELAETDLSNILAFYRTPSGQRMLAKEAEIGGAIGTLAQNWAMDVAERAVTEATNGAAAVPDLQHWRQVYIASPDKVAILQKYIEPMDKPEWTALRTVTLAKLIADECHGSQMNQYVLDEYLSETGLDKMSINDLDLTKSIVAAEFSYLDVDRLRVLCAAAGDLFGEKGRLVPNLVSSGTGIPKVLGTGYLPTSPFTDFPHRRG